MFGKVEGQGGRGSLSVRTGGTTDTTKASNMPVISRMMQERAVLHFVVCKSPWLSGGPTVAICIGQTWCWVLGIYYFILSSQRLLKGGIVTSILQRRKTCLREATWLVQGHIGGNLTSGPSASRACTPYPSFCWFSLSPGSQHSHQHPTQISPSAFKLLIFVPVQLGVLCRKPCRWLQIVSKASLVSFA